MPLFRASWYVFKAHRRTKKKRFKENSRKMDEDGAVLSLERLCLLSLADNMKEVWVKDYAENYLDHYSFRYIMGPFNFLSGNLVEDLTCLLCARKQLSRAALHLLLVPQLRNLSLESCPGLVNSALCSHIAARCQGLCSLNLNGAQQLHSNILSEALCCLPELRSLSLAGTPCDRSVIRAIANHCHLLRHLDVSGCHSLSPAALLLLGRRTSRFSSHCLSEESSTSQTSGSAPWCPSLLSSLSALEIGFGEQEGDLVAVAAYLLLSLPCLERVAMDGFAQACCLIRHGCFEQTDEFNDQEGVPRLRELLQEWNYRQDVDSCRKRKEGATADVEEGATADVEEGDEEKECLDVYNDESDEDVNIRRRVLSHSSMERLTLSLKEVEGLTCDSLNSLSHLCPHICSISVNIDEDARRRSQWPLLVSGLQRWAGQLQRLFIRYSGPLVELIPALQVAGSSLLSLTLEDVKTSQHTPLLEVIKACPRLRTLLISAEPPTLLQLEEEEEQQEEEEEQQQDLDFPQLPNLSSLTFRFPYEHSRMKPIMSWRSLKQMLRCLLTGSPLLKKLSLVSLPCPLNEILQDVLSRGVLDHHFPLGRLQHLEFPRTDVTALTVKSIMQRSKRLKYIDVTCCWEISHHEWWGVCKSFSNVEVVWL